MPDCSTERQSAAENAGEAIKSFLLSLLRLEGMKPRRRSNGIYVVRLTPEWESRLHRKTLRFTFDRETACEHADAELMALGSPVLDAFVEAVKSSPRWVKRYAPVRHRWSVRSCERRLDSTNFAPLVKAEKNTYACYFRLTFMVSYTGIESGRRLVAFAYDPFSERLSEGATHPRGEDSFMSAPARSIPLEVGEQELQKIVHRCVGKLKRRFRSTLARLQAESRKALDEESMRLSRYYQDLIWEEQEKDLRISRLKPAYPQRVAEKTRELKLEWERRLALERERLLPSLSIRLVGVEMTAIPVKRLRILVREHPEVPPAFAYYDLFRGVLGRPRCPACGKRTGTLIFSAEGAQILCKSCFAGRASCVRLSG